MKLREKIIVALDVDNAETCKELVSKLYPKIKMFKIGSQLFTTAGREAVSDVKRRGAGCFLDLKFHDIPATVSSAAKAATKLGIDIFDIHASGGTEMMKAAVKTSRETAEKLNIKKPLILGITVLTSMNKGDLEAMGIKGSTEDRVLFLAELAKKAGLDGVVASPQEIVSIKKNLGDDLLVVTPGIRPTWAEKADQKRVTTPKEAFERGADYIVIGRPITKADDPKDAVERIIQEIE